jgi:16S rRNA (guanine1516-N2)-methyltransferase
VTAVERSAVLGALLHDGLERATAADAVEGAVLSRIKLVVGDAIELLSQSPDQKAPEVVYLDPMYPLRGKTALPKKEMRLLRRLVGDDEDAGELFNAAARVARDRVVVKRTPRAPPLAPKPSISCRGKLARYDVYLTRR